MQQLSLAWLQAGIALMAFVSLLPYFLWSYQKPAYAVATSIVLAAAAGSFPAFELHRSRLVLSVAFGLFLVYLSVLPKVHGGTTRWFLLIPFVVVLLHLRTAHLQRAFAVFHWLFALSLLPGMLLWILLLAGVPLELGYITPPADIVQRGVTEYVEWPGAVFMLANGIVLPHGGVLFRLCAVYDEPGTVGTISALCLAATRFRLGDVKGAISLAAGLMSLSIAFAALSVAGLLATALAAKRPALLPVALLCAAVGFVPLSGMKFGDVAAGNMTIVIPAGIQASLPSTPSATLPAGADGSLRQRFVPAPEWGLRNTPGLDSRSQPWMRTLLGDYLASPVATLMFGVASDASIVHGWGSSVWYRILTDFGIVGFLWLFALFAWPPFQLWRHGRLHAGVVIFCGLFLMSFYQRPIIWLPAQLLIYFAGLYRNTRDDV